MRRHTTESFVKAAHEMHGSTYGYENVKFVDRFTKVAVTCRVHGEFLVTPKKHLSGVGCRKCVADKTKRTTEQFVQAAIVVHGTTYNYGNTEYVGTNKELRIDCPTHGAFYQVARVHLKGHKCPKCANVAKKTTAEFIEEATRAHEGKYTYNNTNYTSANKQVSITCPVHGEFKQIAGVHLAGGGCRKCRAEEARGRASKRLTPTVQEILGRGLPYVYDFTNVDGVHGVATITCDKGHTFQQRIDGALKYGCPTCAKRHSKGEQELLAFVQSLVPNAVRTRKVIAPQELDVWCADQKIGFEYNGLYYHSDAFDGAKWRHSDKSKAVEAAGGRLVHIWADDWVYRRNACETMIKAQLGLLERVHARETEVVLLNPRVAREFLDQWHLQGYTGGTYYGLLHAGRLVASMGFSRAKSIRGNKDEGLWELVRFCANAKVVGGASKLLAAWKRSARDWRTLVTYCDHAQFSGGLYESLGFTRVVTRGPDYKVILAGGDRRRHKSSVKKANLKVLLGDKYDETKSETELCRENHIFRVWDCGKSKYVLARQ